MFIASGYPVSQTVNSFIHEFITKTLASVWVYWRFEIRKYQKEFIGSNNLCKPSNDAALQSVFIICAPLHFIIQGKVFPCPKPARPSAFLLISHKMINREGRDIFLTSVFSVKHFLAVLYHEARRKEFF